MSFIFLWILRLSLSLSLIVSQCFTKLVLGKHRSQHRLSSPMSPTSPNFVASTFRVTKKKLEAIAVRKPNLSKPSRRNMSRTLGPSKFRSSYQWFSAYHSWKNDICPHRSVSMRSSHGKGELLGGRQGHPGEDRQQGGIDHGMKDLLQHHRGGDGIHCRFQSLAALSFAPRKFWWFWTWKNCEVEIQTKMASIS